MGFLPIPCQAPVATSITQQTLTAYMQAFNPKGKVNTQSGRR